jgi:hypothetical protein
MTDSQWETSGCATRVVHDLLYGFGVSLAVDGLPVLLFARCRRGTVITVKDVGLASAAGHRLREIRRAS